MTGISKICRDCGAGAESRAPRCAACDSPRFVAHPELFDLSVAHLDCDAFYASVEKRDNPALEDRPVIVGGAQRGVVSTACYIARAFGVKSAMPMYKARALCPDAVILKPDMRKYGAVARQIRDKMRALTPLVEPLSIDEAFLDLGGTARLHGAAPAPLLVRLQAEIRKEIGVTVSVGLSHNKFLAKIASDREKPRGFSVIGKAETVAVLASMPVGVIWGVGAKMAARLEADGFRTLKDLQSADAARLAALYGALGLRLARLAFGEDSRRVDPEGERKTISAETTFETDLSALDRLDPILWRLCERVAAQLKAAGLSGRVVNLKLKDAAFRTLTRRVSLERPTHLARLIYDAAAPLLTREADGRAFRLIGVGVGDLMEGAGTGTRDLFADPREQRLEAEDQAVDAIRKRFGDSAISSGRAFAKPRARP